MDLSNGLDTEGTLSFNMNTGLQSHSETSYVISSNQWVICRHDLPVMALDLCHHK